MVNKVKKTFIYHSADYATVSKLRKDIDELLINGNIYVSSSDNMTKKLAELAIPVSIDPMAYSLQARIKDQLNVVKKEDHSVVISIKPSLLKLFESFGLDVFQLNSIKQNDLKDTTTTFFEFFKDSIIWENFIKNVKNNFNEKKIVSSISDSILLSEIHNNHESKVISPTFIIDSVDMLNINKKIANSFSTILILVPSDKKFNNEYTLDFLQYCIDQGKDIMFWFEPGVDDSPFLDLIKHHPQIKFSVKFAGYDMLVKSQKMSLNLHAVISAFGYGDSRRILPVGGGIPTNKVYDTDLHDRVPFSDFYDKIVAKNINSPEKYLKEICGCDQCRKLFIVENTIDAIFHYSRHTTYWRGMRKFAKATSAAQSISTMHYLYNRILEINSYNLGKNLESKTNLWEESFKDN